MKILRRIPATMATQHPDHAHVPYWKKDGDAFISAQEEVEECYGAFKDLQCQEYMWDWEGKYVDEAVVDKLFSSHYDFFKKVRLGRDVFLTFRLPNIWLEKGYRLARAYMGILTFENLSTDLGFKHPPVFEVILPMTDEAWKILYLQQAFSQVAKLKRETFGEPQSEFDYLRVIPLIEGVSSLTASRKILTEYLALHEEKYKRRPEYLRPFLARSDPALNDGIVPATIAAKIALSEHYRFQEDTGIPVFPIIGAGCLPFRGGLTPLTVEDFLSEYRGVRTVTIQSAFRYDYPREAVKRAIAHLNVSLHKGKPTIFSSSLVQRGERLNNIFTPLYRQSIERWTRLINEFAKAIPPRRERLLHMGLFGYSRGMGGKRLPRAIGFTAALYSLGIPPELIGTGRGLKAAQEKGLLPSLLTLYKNIKQDIVRAGYYLNRENLEFLAKKDSSWQDVKKDVEYVEKIFKIELGPRDVDHYHHRNLVSSAYLLWLKGRDITGHIVEAAKIRGSIG